MMRQQLLRGKTGHFYYYIERSVSNATVQVFEFTDR